MAETVWNDLAIAEGATGGGVSFYWPIPLWQSRDTYPTENGGSTTNRNLPDVCAVGDPQTGVAVYSKINGGWVEIGGKRVSTPIEIVARLALGSLGSARNLSHDSVKRAYKAILWDAGPFGINRLLILLKRMDGCRMS